MPSKEAISISEAESLIMEIIWRQKTATCEEIIASLGSDSKWQEGTVKALLNRLLKKGAVAASKEGRRYCYRPILQRERWLSAETKSFMDRLFEGRLAPLVAHFSSERKLSKKDIAELKRVIADMEGDE